MAVPGDRDPGGGGPVAVHGLVLGGRRPALLPGQQAGLDLAQPGADLHQVDRHLRPAQGRAQLPPHLGSHGGVTIRCTGHHIMFTGYDLL